jgi:hypothetical protein
LRGDPLLLVDTGPATNYALSAPEQSLRHLRVRIEAVEQVLATHTTCGARESSTRSGRESTAYGLGLPLMAP